MTFDFVSVLHVLALSSSEAVVVVLLLLLIIITTLAIIFIHKRTPQKNDNEFSLEDDDN